MRSRPTGVRISCDRRASGSVNYGAFGWFLLTTQDRDVSMSFIRNTAALVLLGGFVAACGETPTVIDGPDPQFAATSSRTAISLRLRSPCTGEFMQVSGTQHLVLRSTADGSGGFHVGASINWSGVSGTSASGTRYQVPISANFSLNVKPPFPKTAMRVAHDRVVAQGAADDFDIRILFHITVDANGNGRVIRRDIETSCSG